MTTVPTAPVKLTAKDFKTDNLVRWCPGCGDYAILATIQKTLPQLGIPKENFAFISGIGCAGRFPYYMSTYGFHTIHGRAPAFATGLKIARPDLSVWLISGDGDSLSIGGNHFIHVLRRNVDINYILFNNEIYGLTKGQYSPTSRQGIVTKSSPMGSLERPIRPLELALGANASFIARTVDRDTKHMGAMMLRAAQYKGTSLLEVYQNCKIFNDGVFGQLTDKKTKKDHLLVLEDGEPLLFAGGEKGIVVDGFELKAVDVAEVGLENILVHDERGSMAYHRALASLHAPTPIGVIRAVEAPTYDTLIHEQVNAAIEKQGAGDLESLFTAGDTWEI